MFFLVGVFSFGGGLSSWLHREVVELDRAGKTAQEILDAFVAKYGEKALMAPKPEGFNLWAGEAYPLARAWPAADITRWLAGA